MARESRHPRRRVAGPGRGTPRTRTAARPPATRGKAASAPSTSRPPAQEPPAARRRPGLKFTRRALALLVVLALLVLSYASSLRVYLDQQHDIAVAQEQIDDSTAAIARLNDQLTRWDDPAYVKAQARGRLGWVMPGEVGYRVIGPDGKPLAGGAEIDSAGARPPDEHPETWWEKLWGSIKTADAPVPVPKKASTITPTTVPTPAPQR